MNSKGEPEEHLISFEELELAGPEDYFNALRNKFQELDIDETDCGVQSHDKEN